MAALDNSILAVPEFYEGNAVSLDDVVVCVQRVGLWVWRSERAVNAIAAVKGWRALGIATWSS